jgi:hypothetical protein
MRAVTTLLLVGLALIFLGMYVLLPSGDTGPPGERPIGYLYVLYSGAASLLVAALLTIRHVWRGDPGAPAIVFFFAIGFGFMTLGAGLMGRGDPFGQIVFVSGSAIGTFEAVLGVRRLWRRTRSRPGAG